MNNKINDIEARKFGAIYKMILRKDHRAPISVETLGWMQYGMEEGFFILVTAYREFHKIAVATRPKHPWIEELYS